MLKRILTAVWLLSLTGGLAQGTFTASILHSPPTACAGLPSRFSVSAASGLSSISWSVNPARSVVFSPNASSDTVYITFPTAASYTVSLITTDAAGTSTATSVVTVSKRASASFNALLRESGYPNVLDLTNYSSNTVLSYWRFSDSPIADSSYNTVKSYAAAGSYSVTLFALGRNGCNDSLTYAFRISDSSSVTLPNVFTPNDDGVNDIFRPITRGLSKLNVWIYNRNGLKVASWYHVNGSWDGRATNGERCADGEYFVFLEAKGFDGKDYHMKGVLSMFR